MKVPVFIITTFLTAALGIEAWTLNTLVDLRTDVAAIKEKLAAIQPHYTKKENE